MPTLLNDQFHKMNHIPSYWPILVFLLLLLPAILPVFKPYVTGTADGLGHKFRLVSFYESLSEGNLRPRWAKEAALGYGAPVFLYNYPLPYYFASLFVRLGNSINGSGQLLSAFSLLFSAIFMFLAARKLTGSLLGGLTAAIVYTYAPYHLQMTYLYDSWGEELAFVFPPLILYLIFNLANHFRPHNKFEIINSKHKTNSKSQNPKTRNILGFGHLNFSIVSNFDIRTVDFIFLVLCWSLFILSHNVSAVMFSPVILVLSFVLTRNKVGPRFGLLILNAFIVAIFLSSFFWLPAWVMQKEMQYPQFLAAEGLMRGSFFKSFSFQLETALAVVKEGVAHYLDFTAGLPIFLVAISSIGYLITKVLHIWHTGSPSRSPFGHLEGVANSNFGQSGGSSLMQAQSFHTFATQQEKLRKSPKGKLFLIGLLDNWVIWILVILFLSFYLTNHASNWLWSIPPLTYILYPFRFLFVTSFTGAILAGILVSHLGTRRNNYHATVRGSCAGRLGGGIAALILVGSALLQGRPYTNPYVDIFPFPDSYFKLRQTINSAPLTRKNMLIREFLPVQVSMQFLEQEEEKYYQEYFQNKQSRREEAFVSSGDGSIEIINNLSELLQMKLKAKDNVGLTINRFYFPNWQGSIDGKNVSIGKDKEGRMVLAVDKGMHEVTLRFGYSKIEKIANMITFFGLIIFAVEMLWIVSRYSI